MITDNSHISNESRSEFNQATVTVFYDGSCPLCSREIAHYRRLKGADRLIWIDITNEHNLEPLYGLQLSSAMARFHVLDARGNWHTGAWGFAKLWSQLPAYRWLASLLCTMRLLPLLDRLYTRFARWRLQHNCRSNICTKQKNTNASE